MSLGPIDICFPCDIGHCEDCTGYTFMGHICQHGCSVKPFAIKDYRIAYFKLSDLLAQLPDPKLREFATDYYEVLSKAPGSSHNHQAWEGGYLHHVTETMNIACQLFNTLNQLRPLPFKVENALVVMYLHDIEKPFKDNPDVLTPLGISWKQYCDETETKHWCDIEDGSRKAQPLHYRHPPINWKAVRRQFRTDIIVHLGIELMKEQWAALEYVEGEHDYSPGKRSMNELGAFCHCCDILSARLWHDKGNGKSWEDPLVSSTSK